MSATEPLTGDLAALGRAGASGVLEVNGGLIDVLGIEPGDRVLHRAYRLTAPETGEGG